METQNIFDRGVAKVRSVVSDMSVEQREFIRAISRFCNDAWLLGWHEGAAGALSYRLSFDEAAASRSYFGEPYGEWLPLGIRAAGLQGECFAVNGAGVNFRNIAAEPLAGLGIVEVNATGDAYRSAWGFKAGGPVTNEFVSHFMYHAVRKAVTSGACRVVYHAHPAHVAALGLVLPDDSQAWSRTLWHSLDTCVALFPEGVGIAGPPEAGQAEAAETTSALMERFSTVVWPHHGVFCSAVDLNAALAAMQALDKAAAVYLEARAANGGRQDGLQTTTDAQLRTLAQGVGVTLRPEYLG